MDWDINIQTRLGVSDKLYNGIKQKEPFVSKMLMNQVIPKSIKNATHKADAAFDELLNLQGSVPAYDFEDGVYFAMPQDPRGVQLLVM